MDEDRLRDLYDALATHRDPHSPFWDGAREEDEPDHDDEPDSEGDET